MSYTEVGVFNRGKRLRFPIGVESIQQITPEQRRQALSDQEKLRDNLTNLSETFRNISTNKQQQQQQETQRANGDVNTGINQTHAEQPPPGNPIPEGDEQEDISVLTDDSPPSTGGVAATVAHFGSQVADGIAQRVSDMLNFAAGNLLYHTPGRNNEEASFINDRQHVTAQVENRIFDGRSGNPPVAQIPYEPNYDSDDVESGNRAWWDGTPQRPPPTRAVVYNQHGNNNNDETLYYI